MQQHKLLVVEKVTLTFEMLVDFMIKIIFCKFNTILKNFNPLTFQSLYSINVSTLTQLG